MPRVSSIPPDLCPVDGDIWRTPSIHSLVIKQAAKVHRLQIHFLFVFHSYSIIFHHILTIINGILTIYIIIFHSHHQPQPVLAAEGARILQPFGCFASCLAFFEVAATEKRSPGTQWDSEKSAMNIYTINGSHY